MHISKIGYANLLFCALYLVLCVAYSINNGYKQSAERNRRETSKTCPLCYSLRLRIEQRGHFYNLRLNIKSPWIVNIFPSKGEIYVSQKD